MRTESAIPENGDPAGAMALPAPLERRLEALSPVLSLPRPDVPSALRAVPSARGRVAGIPVPSAAGRDLPGYPVTRVPEADWPAPPRGWFCRFEDGLARRLPWAIDFGTD
jgi:hypothetical protein